MCSTIIHPLSLVDLARPAPELGWFNSAVTFRSVAPSFVQALFLIGTSQSTYRDVIDFCITLYAPESFFIFVAMRLSLTVYIMFPSFTHSFI